MDDHLHTFLSGGGPVWCSGDRGCEPDVGADLEALIERRGGSRRSWGRVSVGGAPGAGVLGDKRFGEKALKDMGASPGDGAEGRERHPDRRRSPINVSVP